VRRLVLLVLLLFCVAGTVGASGAWGETPQPAGSQPSNIATMVCQKKAQTEIGDAMGVGAMVTNRTWAGHVYSCDYRYPDATMVVSVKELSSWSQTLRYFNGLAKSLGKTVSLPNLGQGAFQVQNGSVVVRKDWKVLLVNVHGLPVRFGAPPGSRAELATTVAVTILGCWDGD
jgi:hypothetical protein